MTQAELKTLILAQPAGGQIWAAYADGDDERCARLLRETLAPTAALPPMESMGQLMPLLTASFAAAFAHPRFSDMRDTFNKGNRAGVCEFAAAFAAAGVITAGERDAVIGYLMTPVEQQLPLVAGCTHAMVSAAREAA